MNGNTLTYRIHMLCSLKPYLGKWSALTFAVAVSILTQQELPNPVITPHAMIAHRCDLLHKTTITKRCRPLIPDAAQLHHLANIIEYSTSSHPGQYLLGRYAAADKLLTHPGLA